MTTEQFKKAFKNNFINGETQLTNSSFFRAFGKSYMTLDEAFPIYMEFVEQVNNTSKKVQDFEKFLRSKGVNEIQSSKSESRYYYYEGVKYRFSSHVYPTGSMTNDSKTIIDLCADSELIHSISF